MSDQTTSGHAGLDAGGSAAPRPASRWEDFVDIFYAPSDVFARREHSGFGIPMLVVTVMMAIIFYAAFNAMGPIMDAEFARGAAAAVKKGATPEMIEKMRGLNEKLAKVVAPVMPPVMMFLTGLVLWLCGKLVSARQSLSAAIMVASFAYVPRVLGALLGAVQALVMSPESLTGRYAIGFSPARFLNPDTAAPLLVAFLGRLDLFTLWVTALLAIGLAVTGRIPRSRAAIAAALVWLIGSLPELLGALRQS